MHTPAVLLADYGGTLEVANSTELRLRTNQGASAGPAGAGPVGFDAFVQPSARARVTSGDFEYTLGALPSLTLVDLEDGYNQQLLLVGAAGAAWHDHRTRIAITEDVTYGTTNSATPLPQQSASPTTAPTSTGGMGSTTTSPVALQLAPAPGAITTLSSRSAATFSFRADRQTTLYVTGSYAWSGGLGTESELSLPQQQGPRVDASLTYRLSGRDQMTTLAYAQGTSFADAVCVSAEGASSTTSTIRCRPEDQLGQVSQGIRHALDHVTDVSLTAGATVARTHTQPSSPFHTAWFPNADLLLSRRFGVHGITGASLEVGLTPGIDILTGTVNNRLQGQASMALRVTSDVSVTGSATGWQTVPASDPQAASFVSGTAEVAFRASRLVQLAVGERAAWQAQNTSQVQITGQAQNNYSTFFYTVTYFDVTVRASALRF